MESSYPVPYRDMLPASDNSRSLAAISGLTEFSVHHLDLPPGKWSSQRHWNSTEDEFFYVLAGEVVLITDAGESTLHAGDSAGFKAGVPNGHHFINKSDQPVHLLRVGTAHTDTNVITYPDIDLMSHPDAPRMRHKDGTPYPKNPQGQ